MNLFGKTGLGIAATIFALWIVVPLLLIVIFRVANAAGGKGNIDLLIGFLMMVSLAGVVFAVAYAVAAFFGKPWLIAAPVLILIVMSVAGSVVAYFRPMTSLQTKMLTPDAPDPATVLANQSGVPLESMLLFATPTMSKTSEEAVAKVVQTRQRELAAHITEDRGLGNQALCAAKLLTNPAPEIIAAVQAEGQTLAGRIRRFNELNQAADCAYLGHVFRDRFQAWSAAWNVVHRHAGLDGRAPIQEILELAQVRSKDCEAINELRLAAQTAVENLPPPPK